MKSVLVYAWNGASSATLVHKDSMTSGIVVVRIQTIISARYAIVSAKPTRNIVGIARSSVRTRAGRLVVRLLVRLEHLAHDVLERRILDRQVSDALAAEEMADDLAQLVLRHLDGRARAVLGDELAHARERVLGERTRERYALVGDHRL